MRFKRIIGFLFLIFLGFDIEIWEFNRIMEENKKPLLEAEILYTHILNQFGPIYGFGGGWGLGGSIVAMV